MDVKKLVRMVNQISTNLSYGPDTSEAAEAVADHLRRFWSPPMLAQILEHYAAGGEGLSEVSGVALGKLAEQQTSAA
jgi:formate dehydrogenase subunit delta